jgi:photosynthetic reaction center cytochrome c subunit
MKSLTAVAIAGVIVAGAFVVFVPTYTGVPRAATEVGFPQQVQFHGAAERAAVNQAPPPLPPAASGGPSAVETYKNVKVLTDVSAAEFMRLQTAITDWVSPKQGCAFCHEGNDFASDAKPAKAAARVMLQMTRHLNRDWTNHNAGAGVTCYTCHRGQPVPEKIWFPSTPKPQHPFIAPQENWREAADSVYKFFPDDGFAEYYYDSQPIAVQSTTVEPSGTVSARIEAKRIYEMMMEQSDDLGVNCGFCHNSRNFQSWAESTPYRWIGYSGIQMVRDVNRNYLRQIAALVPQTRTLTTETDLPVLPARESGPQIGNGLVVCGTCHLGLSKPLGGVNMVHDYPGLTGPAPVQPAAATAAPPPG